MLCCCRQIENTAAWGASLMDEDDEDDAADKKETAPTGANALWSQFQVRRQPLYLHTCHMCVCACVCACVCVCVCVCVVSI